MDSTVIVAAISLIGTFVGTAGGIIASGKLVEYRLEQLEKKIDTCLKDTSKIPVIEEKITGMKSRITVLEKKNIPKGYYDCN